jgi:hypothetical protein
MRTFHDLGETELRTESPDFLRGRAIGISSTAE